MATGFRNLTVYKKAFALACEYISKEVYDDFNERSEEIGRLLNHIPAYAGLKSINNSVFRLPTGDCGLPTCLPAGSKVQSIRKSAITKQKL